MSLVELLVAMFVTGILLAGVATVFAGTLNGVRTVNTKTSTTADARISMEAITRTLRVAYKPTGKTSAIALATDHTLSFYALLNRTGVAGATPLPAFIEYDWAGNCLTEAKTPGRINAVGALVWDTGRTSKCLARTTIPPDFGYYPDSVTSTPLPVPSGGLASLPSQTVDSIEITVTVKDPGNPTVGGVPIVSRVTLINVLIGA
jgi:type II secretory pathway pseudopilin PulG